MQPGWRGQRSQSLVSNRQQKRLCAGRAIDCESEWRRIAGGNVGNDYVELVQARLGLDQSGELKVSVYAGERSLEGS
jgi:hypothetical protein